MKKYIYLMLVVVAASLMGACSKDEPFDNMSASGTGGLLSSALDVALQSGQGPRSVRDRNVRAAAPDVKDFDVAFYLEDASEPEATYKYALMPEIVTLPVGSYRVVASYGENQDAAWEKPYYEGSSVFEIKENVITDEVEPIKCRFANVRVSVSFSDELLKAMDSDCKVTVKVGDRGSLDFTVNDVDRSGYFRFVEGSSTLAAEFNGTVDGVKTHDLKTRTDIVAGTYYSIRFTLRDAGMEDPGYIVPHPEDGLVSIDADITIEDMNNESVDSYEEPMEDDWRPQEGDEPGKEDPDPEQPSEPAGNPPAFTTNPGISMDKRNYMEDGMEIDIKVTSETGFTEFIVEIQSEILGPAVQELLNTTTLTLVNTPDDYKEFLEAQGFPTNVQGKKTAEISIGNFVPMIKLLAAGEHGEYNFLFTVSDSNGTTKKTLTLYD